MVFSNPFYFSRSSFYSNGFSILFWISYSKFGFYSIFSNCVQYILIHFFLYLSRVVNKTDVFCISHKKKWFFWALFQNYTHFHCCCLPTNEYNNTIKVIAVSFDSIKCSSLNSIDWLANPDSSTCQSYCINSDENQKILPSKLVVRIQ